MFDTICLIGNGVLAKDCCKLLSPKHNDIRFYDANTESSWYLKKNCSRFDNVTYRFLEKQDLFDEIAKLSGRILIISAVNPYIIPESIVDSKRFRAVNLHHSLLPLHPGRNAEAWTIYEEDRYAGITWHLISNDVDGGDVIASSRIELDDTITSWKLLKLQNALALTEFDKFCDSLLRDEVAATGQEAHDPSEMGCRMHYSYEKPNDGIMDITWPAHKISAFLRAMDYGPALVMGYPQVKWKDHVYEATGYTINAADTCDDIIRETENGIIISREGLGISLELK